MFENGRFGFIAASRVFGEAWAVVFFRRGCEIAAQIALRQALNCCEGEAVRNGAKRFAIEGLASAGGQAARLNTVTSGGRNVPGGNSTSKHPERKATDAIRWTFTISLYSASYALYSAAVSA